QSLGRRRHRRGDGLPARTAVSAGRLRRGVASPLRGAGETGARGCDEGTAGGRRGARDHGPAATGGHGGDVATSNRRLIMTNVHCIPRTLAALALIAATASAAWCQAGGSLTPLNVATLPIASQT